MTTTVEQAASPLITSLGHLCCGFCDARYDHVIVEDHALTPRQQLRRAASRAGWKQTVADLDVCPADAVGAAAILTENWTLLWSPEHAFVPPQAGPPVMDGDDVPTTTFPAVIEPEAAMAPAGRHPYETPKDSAA